MGEERRRAEGGKEVGTYYGGGIHLAAVYATKV